MNPKLEGRVVTYVGGTSPINHPDRSVFLKKGTPLALKDTFRNLGKDLMVRVSFAEEPSVITAVRSSEIKFSLRG